MRVPCGLTRRGCGCGFPAAKADSSESDTDEGMSTAVGSVSLADTEGITAQQRKALKRKAEKAAKKTAKALQTNNGQPKKEGYKVNCSECGDGPVHWSRMKSEKVECPRPDDDPEKPSWTRPQTQSDPRALDLGFGIPKIFAWPLGYHVPPSSVIPSFAEAS